jgi:hypothetical protein
MHHLIQDVLRTAPAHWVLLLDYHLLRLRRRIAAVLVTDRAILVFGGDAAQTEAAALDLADFHAGCQGLPVLPVVLAPGERVVSQRPLPLAGAAPPIRCTRLLLPGLLAQVAAFPAPPGFDPAAWAQAEYRPAPGLMEAACHLYARHGVGHLLLTGSGRGDLARTRGAVVTAVGAARAAGEKVVVFVTGPPGAGKTLCGLDLAFAPGAEAAFLTGNPALLHVLRGALARDAAQRGAAARAARQRIDAVVQPLHAFRDHHAAGAAAPPDRLLVIDEAQRCWTGAYAIRKTQNRANPLTESEPGIILDVMARHEGWCAVVCLLGGGQEIHAGEGGLAAWGAAVAARPGWRALAPTTAADAADPRQRLAPQPRIAFDPALHLGAAVRAYRAPRLVRWVDQVLAGNAAAARRLAGTDLPVRLTRSLDALRNAVRGRSGQRYGLVASSGARRLRAEGLAAMVWHQDQDAVESWFLDSWPDIRSADAMEVAGTEFGVQGLELDRVGVCWDTDLVRTPDGAAWQARAFRATAWTTPRGDEALSNRLNAYRVLLTRARQSTTIWVPQGDTRDPTRDPARYDAIADFLQACGAAPLGNPPCETPHETLPQAALL